jgi:hypothetical protein
MPSNGHHVIIIIITPLPYIYYTKQVPMQSDALKCSLRLNLHFPLLQHQLLTFDPLPNIKDIIDDRLKVGCSVV